MDIYSTGEEVCIDGTWGRMVGKRFYTHVNSDLTTYDILMRKVDVDYELDNQWALLRPKNDLTGYCEIIGGCFNPREYRPKPIEYKRGDIVWVFDDNKWQPVYYWDKNTVSADSYICIKSFTTDGRVRLDDFVYTSEIYSKLPIEIQ